MTSRLASRARRALYLGLVPLISGCMVGPNYVRPNVDDLIQPRTPTTSTVSFAQLEWRQVFTDATLQELIATALEESPQLDAALARIAIARARAGIARSELYPTLSLAAGASYRPAVTQNGDYVPAANALLALDMFYEIDLWGRIRRSTEAAVNELLATQAAYRSVAITLVADVASLYLQLRDVDNRLAIAQDTVRTRRESLGILETRRAGEFISEVEVAQGRILLGDAEAAVEQFLRLRRQTENALSVLLGEAPHDIPRGRSIYDQTFPTEVPVGLPADLLRRRPDILQAERRLAAETARIGAAEALRFPQLTLNTPLGINSDFEAGVTSFFADLGANVVQPVFNARRLKLGVEAAEASTMEALSQYELSILNAFREVEDALIAIETRTRELEVRLRQLRAAQEAFDLSWARYEGGLTSYLEALDIQRSLFSAQLAASETRQLQVGAIVQLYKALGGGWSPELEDSGD